MLSKLPRDWGASLRKVQAMKLVVLPSLTGALTGCAAIAFVELVGLVQRVAIGSRELPLHILPTLPWYQVLLVPALGGLIVGPLIRSLAPEAEGHGVPEVIEAVMLGGGRIRKRVAAVKSLASAVTIGTGGSVGREGPIVQIGAAIGSALGQLLRLPAEQLKTLATCGAAGGIAAVFNAPIAGAFFAVEIIAGNFAMPAFGPVVLSSVVATVISRAYFGDHPAFIVQPYRLERVAEIWLYAGLGVFCGLVAASFIWVMDRSETLAARVPISKLWRPLLGGLILGAMVLAIPNVYGVGYATMDAALAGALPWTLLALLVPAKIVATSLTLSSGGSGGIFQPSLYIGAAAGGLYGSLVHGLFPDSTATAGAYALVGMGGVLSAATNSPITAMLLLFEVSGNYAIILPVMIVVTLATVVARAFTQDSLYTLKLSRRGIALHRREDLVMRSHTVAEVMRPAEHILPDRTPMGDLVRYFLEHEVANVYVADGEGRFAGAVSIHDIKAPEFHDLGPVVLARDVAELNPQALVPTDTLADSMNRFLLSRDDELPVVDGDGRLVGVVSRGDVLRVYSTDLLRHEYLGVAVREQGPDDFRRLVRVGPGLTMALVPTPPWLRGRSLRDVNLRAAFDLTVVAIRHRGEGEAQLPDPEAPLNATDVLVVVGKSADIDRLRDPQPAQGANA